MLSVPSHLKIFLCAEVTRCGRASTRSPLWCVTRSGRIRSRHCSCSAADVAIASSCCIGMATAMRYGTSGWRKVAFGSRGPGKPGEWTISASDFQMLLDGVGSIERASWSALSTAGVNDDNFSRNISCLRSMIG